MSESIESTEIEIESVEEDIDRILKLLREKIRVKGYNQGHVQDALGWGGSYISQLLTKHKRLRFDQVLMILDFIDVAPEAFVIEAFHIDPSRHRVDSEARRLGDLLVEKGLISRVELNKAFRTVKIVSKPPQKRRPRRRRSQQGGDD